MTRSTAPFSRLGRFLLLLILLAGGTVVATRRAAAAAAAISDAGGSPVRFAAQSLSAPPPGALNASPKDWAALVPNCTAAFLHAGIAAAAPNTTVVTIDIPAGRVTSLRGCETPAGRPMGHVRLVLAMGRSSAVALDAWDVELGGVTIEGPAGAPNTLIDALVVVRGASRIVTRTSATRAALSGPEHDVHALSVVTKSGATALVAGLGLVVTEGSVVRAEHDGAGVLYASACAVRAEATAAATISTEPSLTMKRVRIAVALGSVVEAVATRSGASYEAPRARRAHAATVQVLQGARVEASRVLVAVLNGSSVAASGDDCSAAAGGIAVHGALARGTTPVGPTSIAASHVALIAAGPHTSVRVTVKGHGIGSTAMGVAAARGEASISNATLYAAGPNTTVAVRVGSGAGYGASAMGVAAYSGATASMTDAAVYAVGPNTTVGVRAFRDPGFSAAFALGVATRSNGAAMASEATGNPSPSAWRP